MQELDYSDLPGGENHKYCAAETELYRELAELKERVRRLEEQLDRRGETPRSRAVVP